jgi:signal transduction histidine kinase
MKSFGTLRGRLTVLASLAALVAIGALTIAFNIVIEVSVDREGDGRLRAQAAAAATTVVNRDGHLTVRESPGDSALDRQVWVYEGTRAVERPQTSAELQRAADALVGKADVFVNEPEDMRLYAAPIRWQDRQVGTLVTGHSVAAYDRTTDIAQVGSVALAGILLAAVFVLTWMSIGRALDPVREMTRTAADWSDHDVERRFGSSRLPAELAELAHTFDALLARVARSLRREQRLTAELSHELRTPLARITAQVELLQRRDRSPVDRRDAHDSIARNADEMNRILETLMTAARAEAGLDQGRSDVRTVLAGLQKTWGPPLGDLDLELYADRLPSPLLVGVDGEVVERIVTPLLENAGRYARTRVDLGARRAGDRVEITVADDGPGVPAEARDAVFEPGTRMPGRNGHGGAGLGLALSRRLARAAGGDVTVADSPATDGARFCVRLPA